MIHLLVKVSVDEPHLVDLSTTQMTKADMKVPALFAFYRF
jgi:hypothetical protein